MLRPQAYAFNGSGTHSACQNSLMRGGAHLLRGADPVGYIDFANREANAPGDLSARFCGRCALFPRIARGVVAGTNVEEANSAKSRQSIVTSPTAFRALSHRIDDLSCWRLREHMH